MVGCLLLVSIFTINPFRQHIIADRKHLPEKEKNYPLIKHRLI